MKSILGGQLTLHALKNVNLPWLTCLLGSWMKLRHTYSAQSIQKMYTKRYVSTRGNKCHLQTIMYMWLTRWTLYRRCDRPYHMMQMQPYLIWILAKSNFLYNIFDNLIENATSNNQNRQCKRLVTFGFKAVQMFRLVEYQRLI